MVSLKLSLSRSASESSFSHKDDNDVEEEEFEEIKRPTSVHSDVQSSASSSCSSLGLEDTEDLTITANRRFSSVEPMGQSTDDLRLLAVSTHMTELSYNISDIQTRIFEIQELRHQSQASQSTSGSSTGVIDQALMNLDERLETINSGMKTVSDAIEPLRSQTPKPSDLESNEHAALLRKHAALVAEWESVQDETDVLKEELKEDKWLTVFRTVSEQADGMMSSLEKAVKRCQDFIWRVHRREPSEDNSTPWSPTSDSSKAPLTYETFCTLLESFQAKKKHYMPATSKVLSIIDKGVRDRVTKNGECLRRHAESTQRWKSLRERISRTDSEMENVCKILLGREAEVSEVGSTASHGTSKSQNRRNGHLTATPSSSESSRGRTSSTQLALSRSISPFRKFAKRFSRSGNATPKSSSKDKPLPATEPAPTIRHRSSLFPLSNSITNTMTPERPRHKHSQSFTPDSSPSMRRADDQSTSAFKVKPPKWNSSTKIAPGEGEQTIKQALRKRTSATYLNHSYSTGDIPPVPPLPGRSLSRSSLASSRPWSPLTASAISTGQSSYSRPPSRAQSPRARPKTPSQIPTPVFWLSSADSEGSYEGHSPPSSMMQRAISPSLSTSATSAASYSTRAKTPLGSHVPHPRPPSRSMIPIPKFNASLSRPTSSMSNHDRSESSMSFRPTASRAQTPESALRSRVAQLPIYQDTSYGTPPASRRQSRLPPSSFRESASTPSRTSSRTGSRAGSYTPLHDQQFSRKYVPANHRDLLDAEIAAIVNSIPHGLLVERVDPPLPARAAPPKEGEEVKAQYAFSNQLARKVITCRLLTFARSGYNVKTKKVMCRVGGGWQDLQLYILNRQAGM